jgi:hypothetical protein
LVAAVEEPEDPARRSSALIVFHNDLGAFFKLRELHVLLDGASLLDVGEGAPGDTAGKDKFTLVDGPLAPGKHELTFSADYTGQGLGVFQYLEGYKFTVKDGKAFVVEEGRHVTVRVTVYDKGNITSELKDRPGVRFAVESTETRAGKQARVARPGDPTTPGAAADSSLLTAEEFYDARTRAITERIDDLNARIGRARQRLALMQDAVLHGVSASRARITHRNEMGASFQLREVHYFLDGAPLREEIDETGETLAKKDEFDLFDGAIVPGEHQLTVNLVYQGAGYGVFSYLNDQQVRIRSTHSFTAQPQKETLVKVVVFESGAANAQARDRATIRYDTGVRDLPSTGAPGVAPPPADEPPPAAEPSPPPAAEPSPPPAVEP